MSLTSKILATLAIAAAVVVAIWLGLFRDPVPAPQPPSPPEAEPTLVKTNPSSIFTRPGAKVPRTTNVVVAEVSVAATNLMTDWEDRVDQILGDDTEVEAKARKMLELFPHFPEAGQVETVQHIANLLADEDYEKFGNYLTNPKTPASVQDVILADVLNRPSEIKLPLLLQTARNPDNAKASEAKELLELYLEEDYGPDWDKWEKPMRDYLKENPD